MDSSLTMRAARWGATIEFEYVRCRCARRLCCIPHALRLFPLQRRGLRGGTTVRTTASDKGERGEIVPTSCQEAPWTDQDEFGEAASVAGQEATRGDSSEFAEAASAAGQEASTSSVPDCPECKSKPYRRLRRGRARGRGQVQGRPSESKARRGPHAHPKRHRRTKPRTDQAA
jgi:hypothetical protein